jgi:ABC-type transport system substrate-binding protein
MTPRGTNAPEYSDPGLVQLATEWTHKGLSRRDFVRLTGAGVGAATLTAFLAACGAESTPTTAPVASTAPSVAPSTAASVAPTAATGGAASTAPSTAASAVATRAATASGAATPAAGGASGLPSGGKYSTLEPVGKKGGTFVETVVADAKTNNSMLSTDVPSNDRISIQFSSILALNPDTALPFPLLATDVPSRENGGISQDGLTYTFKLRKDVKWHDGQPFTSKDVVFTYQTLAKKELGSPRTAEINDRVDSVTAPDDYTVVFKLKKIVAPFLVSNIASNNYSIVPEHILGSVAVDQIKQHPFSIGDPKASIGTGPFKFKEWAKDDHATFVKNPDYFGGEPAIDQYIFKVVKDQDVVVANLKTGEGDFGAIPTTAVDDVSKTASLSVVKYDTYGFTFYSHQLDASKTTLFQQKEVRQALAYAIDRDAIVQAIYNGYAVIGQGTMPTLSFAYAPDQITTKYPYDIKKAEQLLDAAGWVKGSDGINQQGLRAADHGVAAAMEGDRRRCHAEGRGMECLPLPDHRDARLRDVPGRLQLGCRSRSDGHVGQPVLYRRLQHGQVRQPPGRSTPRAGAHRARYREAQGALRPDAEHPDGRPAERGPRLPPGARGRQQARQELLPERGQLPLEYREGLADRRQVNRLRPCNEGPGTDADPCRGFHYVKM